jgi:putative ABC transport system substrate-binding protein
MSQWLYGAVASLRNLPKAFGSRIGICLVVAAVATGLTAMTATVLTPPPQANTKLPVIAFLGGNRSTLDWVLSGLRDIGYVAESDFHLEARLTDGSLEKQRQFAAELVALRPTVIVATGTASNDLTKLTSALPIVVARTEEPDALQMMDSLEHPGRNVTGVVTRGSIRDQRRLSLLEQVVPALTRVAVLNGVKPEVRALADKLHIQLDIANFTTGDQLEAAFDKLAAKAPQALFVGSGPLTLAHLPKIASLAAARKWPSISDNRELPENGGLMSYGGFGNARRVAQYVDKVLKGVKPGDLPAEVHQQWQLVINLKSATQLGLTIPNSLLVQAAEILR